MIDFFTRNRSLLLRRNRLAVVWLAAPLVTLSLFVCSPAAAQMARMLTPPQPAATASQETKPASAEEQRGLIQQALVDAQAQRDQTGLTPLGITQQEEEERTRLLDELTNRLNAQLMLLDERDEVRRARTAAEQRAQNWTGFRETPPYSVLFVDGVKAQLQGARSRVRGLASTRELFAQQVSKDREALKRAQEKARLASEKLEQAQSPEERTTTAWRQQLASIRSRTAEATASWSAQRYEVLGERLSVAQAEHDFLLRQLAEAREHQVFTQADLNKALAGLTSAQAELERELNTALARNTRSVNSLTRAQQELDAFLARKDLANLSPRRKELENRQQAAQAWVDSSRFEIEVVSALISINQSVAALWQQRYAATVATDAEQRQAVLVEFRQSRDQLQPWLEYAQQQLKTNQAAERKEELRLALLDEQSRQNPTERDLLAAKRLQRELAERLQVALEQGNDTLQAWQEELTMNRQSRTLAQRLREDIPVWLAGVAGKVWTFELLTVEDTVEVGGQTVVTSRGVTVGKSVGALILFLIGYWLAALLARGVKRIMVGRFRIGEHQADVIRRWLLALTTFILLMVTLNLARIPLTVFAFFGGALAIGVGFGTQTLIKNLISGIMILIERKVQVGNTIEVDGVIGKVTAVDFRASTILGFDGVETIIPNSSFLENKVTNWTFTNARLRRALRIGVAYGSPVVRVREILAECGERHSLVLKDPPPQVFFEDFGDNSLIFILHFWIDFGTRVNPMEVASDLRFMIEERFAQEKISVAFPQRDVHLDSTKPLRVEVVSSAGSAQESR